MFLDPAKSEGLISVICVSHLRWTQNTQKTTPKLKQTFTPGVKIPFPGLSAQLCGSVRKPWSQDPQWSQDYFNPMLRECTFPNTADKKWIRPNRRILSWTHESVPVSGLGKRIYWGSFQQQFLCHAAGFQAVGLTFPSTAAISEFKHLQNKERDGL